MQLGLSIGTDRIPSITGSGGGGIAPTGLFQIAANGFKIGTGTIASTGTLNECASRSKHPIAGRYSSLKVAYHAWYFTTSTPAETPATQWDIKKAALELGATSVPILFSGGRTLSVGTGQAFYLSDEIFPVAFGLSEFTTANCANLWHRIEATAAVGGTNHWAYMIPGQPTGTFSYKYAQANTLNQVDSTGAMSIPTSATANGVSVITPLMIVGKSVVGGQLSVLGHGDSISVGAGSGFTAKDGGIGLISEALWNGGTNPIPGLLVGKISAAALEYAASNAYRRAIMPYTNVCLTQFGTNDIQANSQTGAQVFANNKRIWDDSRRAGVQRVVHTKLMPDTDVGHAITALSQVGGLATATIDDTSWMTGQLITVSSVTPSGYNVVDFTASVINATQFTYAVNSGTVSPATNLTLAKAGDAFRTKLGQVPKTEWTNGSGARDIANGLFSAAVPTKEVDAFSDTLTPVADLTDDHYWKTSGSTPYPTDDGVHPNQVISAAASVAIYNSLIALTVDQVVAAPVCISAANVTSIIPQVGQTLTCDAGVWNNIAGATVAYVWKRNGSAIGGATSASYVAQVADVGTTITREQTYTNSFGSATGTTTFTYVWASDGLTRFFSDAFNDINAQDITLHTSDSGAGWTKNGAVGTSAWRTSGFVTGRTYPAVATSLHYANTVPSSADYIGYAVIDNLSLAASQNIGITLRQDTAAHTCYSFAYSRTAGAWQINKLVAGVSTNIAQTVASLNIGQLYSIKAVCTGTAQQLYVDGVLTCTGANVDIAATGQFGLRNSGITATSTTGLGVIEVAASN